MAYGSNPASNIGTLKGKKKKGPTMGNLMKARSNSDVSTLGHRGGNTSVDGENAAQHLKKGME